MKKRNGVIMTRSFMQLIYRRSCSWGRHTIFIFNKLHVHILYKQLWCLHFLDGRNFRGSGSLADPGRVPRRVPTQPGTREIPGTYKNFENPVPAKFKNLSTGTCIEMLLRKILYSGPGNRAVIVRNSNFPCTNFSFLTIHIQ